MALVKKLYARVNVFIVSNVLLFGVCSLGM